MPRDQWASHRDSARALLFRPHLGRLQSRRPLVRKISQWCPKGDPEGRTMQSARGNFSDSRVAANFLLFALRDAQETRIAAATVFVLRKHFPACTVQGPGACGRGELPGETDRG